ncbi:MAG: trypsin-like serine protease [Deltaproteobacteria bacterium]|nr:trypsin-like serine protease [Deltaproteobacteria bacterium]
MRKYLRLSCCILLVFLVGSFTVACEETGSRIHGPANLDDEEMQIRNQGIIGGTPTNYKDWKGVVMVSAGGLCSGTLIHPRVVLSAGHCVKLNDAATGQNHDYTLNPGAVSIRGGANMFTATTFARGQEIVTHPTWTGELSPNAGDLSLILLGKEVTSIPYYPLRDFPVPQSGTKGKLVGYGGTGGMGMGGSPRVGDTTLLNVMSDVIETGDPANTCQGDSGGPMFTEQNGEWVVTGVTSFGTSQNCYKDHGSYSVNVVSYCNWIDKTMKELVGEGLGLEKCSNCDPKKASSWGQPCGEGYEPCPENTNCRAPDDFSNGHIGYCAASCCALGETDTEYCTDIAGGEEKCSFITTDGDRFCAVHCKNDSECPDGTKCKNKPWEDEKICIATEDGPGGPGTTTDVDVDSDADGDTDGDSDSDTDGDSDSDTDGDSDSDTDGDTDSDTDGDADGSIDGDADGGTENNGENDGNGGCGCHVQRARSAGFGLVALTRLLEGV